MKEIKENQQMERSSVFIIGTMSQGILKKGLGLKPLFSDAQNRKELSIERLGFDAFLTRTIFKN